MKNRYTKRKEDLIANTIFVNKNCYANAIFHRNEKSLHKKKKKIKLQIRFFIDMKNRYAKIYKEISTTKEQLNTTVLHEGGKEKI